MELQQKQWKRDADRLSSASPFDVREAASLAAEIARHGADESLRQAAAQALPSLRGACLKTSDQMSRNVARRRFGAIRDALHALDVPRFGKRVAVPAPEQQHRLLLQLPPERQLARNPKSSRATNAPPSACIPTPAAAPADLPSSGLARDALMKRK